MYSSNHCLGLSYQRMQEVYFIVFILLFVERISPLTNTIIRPCGVLYITYISIYLMSNIALMKTNYEKRLIFIILIDGLIEVI